MTAYYAEPNPPIITSCATCLILIYSSVVSARSTAQRWEGIPVPLVSHALPVYAPISITYLLMGSFIWYLCTAHSGGNLQSILPAEQQTQAASGPWSTPQAPPVIPFLLKPNINHLYINSESSPNSNEIYPKFTLQHKLTDSASVAEQPFKTW